MNRTMLAVLTALGLLVWIGPRVHAERLIFKASDGSSAETLVLPDEGGGYSITSRTDQGNHETVTDASFSTLRWIFRNPADGTEITSTRSGNRILVDGTFKGKKFQKTHQVDLDPWYEEWGLGLKGFILAPDKTWRFWSVNPADPNMAAKFEAVKSGEETLVVQGTPVETMRVKVSLPGLLSLFFSADYWFRVSDGTLIRSKVPAGSGKPAVVIDLSSVEQTP